MKNLIVYKIFVCTLAFSMLLLISSGALAYESGSTTLGSMADNLHSGATIVAKLLWAACVIVGIAFMIAAFTQYQVHRVNPKLVPLTTPITYVLLALVALTIPFAERVIGFEDAYENDQQEKAKSQPYVEESYIYD
jgi:hypothetical protein